MMMKKLNVYVLAGLLAISATALLSGCKSEGCTDATATNYDADAKEDDGSCEYATVEETLYDRLGGIDAITAVIDKFLENVVGDEMLSCSSCDFAPTIADPNRVRLLRLNLIDQVCEATGGPCVYKGKTMREAHPAGSVTDDEFNALVGDLTAALEFYSVPQTEQDELLTILGSLKGDIVY